MPFCVSGYPHQRPHPQYLSTRSQHIQSQLSIVCTCHLHLVHHDPFSLFFHIQQPSSSQSSSTILIPSFAASASYPYFNPYPFITQLTPVGPYSPCPPTSLSIAIRHRPHSSFLPLFHRAKHPLPAQNHCSSHLSTDLSTISTYSQNRMCIRFQLLYTHIHIPSYLHLDTFFTYTRPDKCCMLGYIQGYINYQMSGDR